MRPYWLPGVVTQILRKENISRDELNVRIIMRTKHAWPTSTSRDVSDQAFPSLSNFYSVLHCACGGRPGNEANIYIYK